MLSIATLTDMIIEMKNGNGKAKKSNVVFDSPLVAKYFNTLITLIINDFQTETKVGQIETKMR